MQTSNGMCNQYTAVWTPGDGYYSMGIIRVSVATWYFTWYRSIRRLALAVCSIFARKTSVWV